MNFVQVFFATLQTELAFGRPILIAVLSAFVACASETPDEIAIKKAKQLSIIEGDINDPQYLEDLDSVALVDDSELPDIGIKTYD